ncbi:hypothetical protein SLE2022_114270 [Rubroshorea leprosula]
MGITFCQIWKRIYQLKRRNSTKWKSIQGIVIFNKIFRFSDIDNIVRLPSLTGTVSSSVRIRCATRLSARRAERPPGVAAEGTFLPFTRAYRKASTVSAVIGPASPASPASPATPLLSPPVFVLFCNIVVVLLLLYYYQ